MLIFLRNMKLNEIYKGLETLKTLVDQSEDKQLVFADKRKEIEDKFASLLLSLENTMDKPEEKKENTGGMTLEELNDKYVGKYLYFNGGDEEGCQYIYVDRIYKIDGMFAVDGTLLTADYQDSSIKIEYVSGILFGNFFYFDDTYAPTEETCEELDRALQSRPMNTDLPSHVVTRKTMIEDINTIFGSLLSGESGDDIIYEMFSNIQVPTI